jgi:hypothetical protein
MSGFLYLWDDMLALSIVIDVILHQIRSIKGGKQQRRCGVIVTFAPHTAAHRSIDYAATLPCAKPHSAAAVQHHHGAAHQQQ